MLEIGASFWRTLGDWGVILVYVERLGRHFSLRWEIGTSFRIRWEIGASFSVYFGRLGRHFSVRWLCGVVFLWFP